MEFGEDLISLVCLELNARALVSSWEVENLDAMNGGVVGVFIAPTTKLDRWLEASARWRTGQSGAHRTVRCPLPRHHCRWILAVGASDLWARQGVRCTPDMYCLMSGAPVWACLTSARAVRALNAAQGAVGTAGSRWHRREPLLRWHTGQSGAHRTVR